VLRKTTAQKKKGILTCSTTAVDESASPFPITRAAGPENPQM
jgi:hypothetical protein